MNADAEKNEFLGTQPIGSLMFRLAVPAVTAQLVNMLYKPCRQDVHRAH